MRTFEERYTAWIDGRLTVSEQEAFERELDDRPAAEADNADILRLGNLLRTYGTAPEMPNADFFNHQLMTRISAEEEPKQAARTGGVARWLFSWPFARLAWAGACAAVLGWVLARTIMPDVPSSSPQPAYFAQIIETRTLDPNISATVLHADHDDDVAVLWLDGLDYLPASYELQ